MTATAVQVPRKAPANKPVGRESADANRRRQTRTALLLILPTIVAMAIVVGYPIVVSIVNSLHSDFGALDPKTGLFKTGGFVGVLNYTNWLLQQCQSQGKTIACPNGAPASGFYNAIGVTFFFTVVTLPTLPPA